jgi:hypothetical protein
MVWYVCSQVCFSLNAQEDSYCFEVNSEDLNTRTHTRTHTPESVGVWIDLPLMLSGRHTVVMHSFALRRTVERLTTFSYFIQKVQCFMCVYYLMSVSVCVSVCVCM